MEHALVTSYPTLPVVHAVMPLTLASRRLDKMTLGVFTAVKNEMDMQ